MKQTIVYTLAGTAMAYAVLLGLYLLELIGPFIFLSALLGLFTVTSVLAIVYHKHRARRWPLGLSAVVLLVFLIYEFPLLLYLSAPSYSAYSYVPPQETASHTNIYSIGVGQYDMTDDMDEKQIIRLLENQGVDVLSIVPVTHSKLYGVKTRQLLYWLHLQQERDPTTMQEAVRTYLSADPDWLSEWGRKDIQGDSAGLSLALAGLIQQNRLSNQLPIAVTSGITDDGQVLKVGAIEEKLRTLLKAGFSVALLPAANEKEGRRVEKILNGSIQVLYVSTVEEAAEVIEEMNEKEN